MSHLLHKVIGLTLVTIFVAQPVTMYAETTTSYQPRTQLELIAYLQGVLAQLVAQLEAKQGTSQVTTVTTRSRANPNPYNAYAISLAPTAIGRTTATFRGDLDRGSSPTADTWFEYGTGNSLTKRTEVKAVTKTRRHAVSISETDLLPGTRYNYRMVIEDERGNRQYGQVLSFTTVSAAQTQTFTGRPVVETEGVKSISNTGAELSTFVTMNNYQKGYVFLVYSTERSSISDIEDYDSYAEIPKLTNRFKKEVKKDFSGRDRLAVKIGKLKSATRYYYRSCVQFGSPGDGFKCGEIESFLTLN